VKIISNQPFSASISGSFFFLHETLCPRWSIRSLTLAAGRVA
jgi:hypothetical protein